MGPLGVLTPTPGVSYLFHGSQHGYGSHPGDSTSNFNNPNNSHGHLNNPNRSNDGDTASLWGIANGNGNGGTGVGSGHFSVGSGGGPGGMMSPPPSWSPALGDMIQKVDAKLKVRALHSYLKVPLLTTLIILLETHWHAAQRARPTSAQRN